MDTTCKAAGLTWTWCGENVAAGQPTAADVHNAWMASTGHRAAIMRPDATVVGVGAWRDASGRIWWTARFMSSPDVSAPVRAGTRITDLGVFVFASDELFATLQGDTTRFVDTLHRRVLGRPASATELALATTPPAAGTGPTPSWPTTTCAWPPSSPAPTSSSSGPPADPADGQRALPAGSGVVGRPP